MIHTFSFDWATGKGLSGNTGKPEASIVFAGDWAPIRAFKPIIETSPESIYGNLLPVLRESDLSVVNLEAPLSDIGRNVDKSGSVFKGGIRHIRGLNCVPFNAVTLANNHVFDYGVAAFEQTCKVLHDNSIRYTGAGLSENEAEKPMILKTDGLTVGIVNFSEGEDLTHSHGTRAGVMGWDIETVSRKVVQLKEKVDFTVVIGHCGVEYIPFPPPYVAKAFKQLASAGADLVIGHHPHVPQGICFHQHSPICHSLGNFIFFQETSVKFRKLGYMVKAVFNRCGLVSIELIPYEILPDRLNRLQGDTLKSFLNHLKTVSDPLNSEVTIEAAWNGFLDYYGKSGFKNEISDILKQMKEEPKKGAAMFRNRLTTAQHYHHLKDLMSRIVNGELDTAPQWALDLAELWLTGLPKKEQ